MGGHVAASAPGGGDEGFSSDFGQTQTQSEGASLEEGGNGEAIQRTLCTLNRSRP